MTTTRRDFLRALAAGTGLVMVPTAVDRFRWKVRPSGVVVVDDDFTGTPWNVGDHIAVVSAHDHQLNGQFVITAVRRTPNGLLSVEYRGAHQGIAAGDYAFS